MNWFEASIAKLRHYFSHQEIERLKLRLSKAGTLTMKMPHRTFVTLFASLILAGCSRAPSASDAEKVIDEGIHEPLAVISFQKTNGQYGETINAEGFKVESYSLEYDVEIKATKRCELLEPDNPKFRDFRLYGLQTLAEGDPQFPLFTNNVLKPGQTFKMGGTIVFEKTENGWRESEADDVIY